MSLLFAAAFLSSWSYGDFASDPGKSPPVQDPARPAFAPAPSVVPIPTMSVKQAAPPIKGETNPRTEVKKSTARLATPAPAAPPKLWRLADSGGQVWEHADPHWLNQWVATRNAQFVFVAPNGPWTCTASGCYRSGYRH